MYDDLCRQDSNHYTGFSNTAWLLSKGGQRRNLEDRNTRNVATLKRQEDALPVPQHKTEKREMLDLYTAICAKQ